MPRVGFVRILAQRSRIETLSNARKRFKKSRDRVVNSINRGARFRLYGRAGGRRKGKPTVVRYSKGGLLATNGPEQPLVAAGQPSVSRRRGGLGQRVKLGIEAREERGRQAMLQPAHVGHLALLRALIREGAAEGSFDRELASDTPESAAFFEKLKRALVTGYFVEEDLRSGKIETVAVPGYVFWPCVVANSDSSSARPWPPPRRPNSSPASPSS